jgi:anti-sigma factor RsiW
MNDHAPDDTALHAWLDGELTPEQRAQIDAWLREHPEDAARVRLWAADRDALRARFDGVLDEPVPQALAQVVWRRLPQRVAPSFAGWQRWAAALAVFALGGVLGAALMWRTQVGAGTPLARDGEPAWVRRAAVAHAVYVPEVRHAVEVKAQEEHLSRWLTKRLDVPVKLFDLRAQGFELVGGRLLPDAAGPSAQLMYQAIATTDAPGASAADAKPARVTVYLRKPDSDTPAAFRYERQGELGLFYWVEGRSAEGGPCGYAIVGALPREKLLALAETIFKQGDETR